MASTINADDGVISGIAGVKTTADSTGALNIQTNGTTAITISAAQAVSLTNSPTFTGGTANGVLFLNASKVATSGTALVFDGTNLGIGTSSPTQKLNVNGIALFEGSAQGNIIIQKTGTNGFSLFSDAAGKLGFYDQNGAATRMLIDASGNLGLGVTPSAWGGTSGALQNSAGSLWRFGTGNIYLSQNYYYNGTNRIYINTAEATEYQQTAGQHRWHTAPSGTAGNVVTLTQAMTLDASGNLGIGTSSPSTFGKLVVSGAVASSGLETWIQNTTDTGGDNTRYAGLNFSVGSDNGTSAIRVYRTNSASDYSTNMTFWTKGVGATATSPTQRMALDASGNLGIGTTSPGAMLDVAGNARSNAWIGRANGSAPTADAAIYRAADNTLGFSTNNTERARITSDGMSIGTSSVKAPLTVAKTNISFHSSAGFFSRDTSNTAVNILSVTGQASNSGTAIYARLVATGAVNNESAVIEFWAAISRTGAGANTATAVAPAVSKAIVGSAISAGSLAWSGATLQYTPNTTINYVGYSIEIQVTNNDGATITLFP